MMRSIVRLTTFETKMNAESRQGMHGKQRPLFAPGTFQTLSWAPRHRARRYVQNEPEMTFVHWFFEETMAPLVP
jgi:hypothetical protein